MSDNGRNASGQFTEGNQAHLGDACGGEGALRRLADGAPFVGLAHDAELAVTAELETEGRAAIVRRAAVRLESVARLFYAAVEKASSEGDLEKLDRYAQRYGWLQASALRAWAQVKSEQHDGGRLDAAHVLNAIRSGDNGDGK